MKKTSTSSFGSSKRESHDASAFYNRGLHEGVFTKPASKKEIKSIYINPIGDWVDQIYCQSSEKMDAIPDNSIGLAFTSPPYNVGKDYDNDLGLQEYLVLIESVAREVYRVLRPGGRFIVNIANLGRKPYIPLHAFFYEVHTRVGFLPMGEIIWQKAKGANGSCAWGSWISAKAPRLRDIHEYLLVFAKQDFDRPDTGDSSISPTEFMDATLSVWNIPPESAKRVRHPAPFPVELAERVIELYSYVDDVILDPFVGSGSTCVAAVNKKRHYVGFDISEEYCNLANLRIEGKGKLYMPSEKTECSELSVAFGILGVSDPLGLPKEEIEQYLANTLTIEKYSRFEREYVNPKNNKIYSRLHSIGLNLRSNYPLFSNVSSLQWCGPQKQAKTIQGAQDLIVANTPISVKAGSDIIFNLSPYNIFENIPQGRVSSDRSENWYRHTEDEKFQALYTSIRDIRLDHFPISVVEFERTANNGQREELQSEIKKLYGADRANFEKLYFEMCQGVALVSAKKFNKNLQDSLQGSSRSGVLEYIVRHFFRLESIEYILAGIDRGKDYAVRVPSMTQWKQDWEISSIDALPDINRKQSVVNIIVNYKKKKEKEVRSAKFHVEIRWSHGKFCGSPEGKLYKDFKWSDIAFVSQIL